MKTVKVFLGLVTGFTVGALTGMLFASEKEPKTEKGLMIAGEDILNCRATFKHT